MRIKVRIPATTANLGPGFDTLGLALNIFNYIEIDTDTEQLSIEIQGEGEKRLAANESNLSYQAISRVFTEVGRTMIPLKIKQVNEIPLASGLGSSAAAIVGGLTAANLLLNQPLKTNQLLALAADMEGHPDNAAPALLGGLVIAGKDKQKIIYSQIKPNNPPQVIVVIPDYSLNTNKARSVLPNQVPFQDAVDNLSRLALLINCFSSGDYTNLRFGCEDKLHQDYRKSLVPGFDDVISACTLSGGLGAALSGAGPTIVGFAYNNIKQISSKMQAAFLVHGINSRIIVTQINNEGICQL